MKNMYASFKKSRWFPLVIGVLSIVFGILCLTNPAAKMETIALYIGLAIAAYGLFSCIVAILNRDNKKRLASNLILGIILIILAILVFANLSLVGKYLPTVVGFVMILSGIVDLFRSIVLLKNGVKSWWLSAIVAAVVLVLGIIFLLNPGFVGQTIGIFAGIALIINGVSSLINFVQFKK